jgi:hypothetical protein
MGDRLSASSGRSLFVSLCNTLTKSLHPATPSPILSQSMSELQTEYDTPWKDALERYFEEFIAFFFPQAHGDIDWTQGYSALSANDFRRK